MLDAVLIEYKMHDILLLITSPFFCALLQLVKLFPNDSGAHKLDRLIPYLPQDTHHDGGELLQLMSQYVTKLSALPHYILHCDHVTSFFAEHAQSNKPIPEVKGSKLQCLPLS